MFLLRRDKTPSMNLRRMANDFVDVRNDKLNEISRRLEESHLAYLQIDDSPLKLRQRRKLEGIIEEFLCLVPHGNKYVFHETADILHRSAATLEDFSGYRACTAWSAISLYAANLLAQPWRREYRTLRTYSGYYKHEVESNLVGAELMFELMGYKHTSMGVMTLESPIDPDKVSSVSRDAIVAFVECQILKQIWEAVTKKFNVTWLEVLEFREKYAGSPEQAIRALNHCFLEKVNRSHALGYCHTQPVITDVVNQGLPYTVAMSNYNVPLYQPEYQCMDDTSGLNRHLYPLNYSFENRCNTFAYPPRGNKYVQVTNDMHPLMTVPHSRVPTGRLIELDTPNYEKAYNGKVLCGSPDFDEVDSYARHVTSIDRREYGKVGKKLPKTTNLRKENENLETWDYVFQNLESQGYSKDLGDRDNVLYHKPRDTESRTSKHKASKDYSDCEERHTSRNVEKEKLERTYMEEIGHLNRCNNHCQDVNQTKKSSHSEVRLTDLNLENDIIQDKTEQSNIHTVPDQNKEMTEIIESMKEIKFLETDNHSNDKDKNKWNCALCTYLNDPQREICEMCDKSRRKGNEDEPLVSGGKECPKCTLINEKDATHCDACSNSLKDSPTYI